VTDYAPPQGPIPVIHQDDQIIVVVKPEGLLSVPGRGEHLADCLISRLAKDHPSVRLVHRLDRDTSGVMVFALTPLAQRHLNWQFEERIPQKTYVARVAGHLAATEGTVDLPIALDWPNRPLHIVDHVNGRNALTHWERLAGNDHESRVRLHPKTGRSHQLRVHMQAIGHPILGDPFYASGPARDDHPRLMLHSETLVIRHPDGGAFVTFTAPAPF
jgi:tRNA pseudouridine32 synthase / 23S rRNA pseudouridine746 synthase